MRSGPDQRAGSTSPSTPTDRLVRRTSRSLALVTLGLIAALLAGVGLVTAAVALGTTDAAIDRTLHQAASTRLAALEEQAAQQPEESTEPVETDEPRDDEGQGGSGSDDGDQGGDDQESSPPPAATPEPTAVPTFGLPDLDDSAPESADTFFLLLAADGAVISNPQRVALTGLPDGSAAQAAKANGDDWRTVEAGGKRIRLLTQRVVDERGNVAGILQSGFVLDLRDRQASELLTTILLTSLVGLAGAALVTLVVTNRALRPIRSAFAAERRFVATASHELRTPVAVVRASAEILQREELVMPGGDKLVSDIISESDRLARLVSDLLALASAEAGAISVERRPIELRAFVDDLARRAGAMAGERGVRIEIAQEGDLAEDHELFVSADPDRLAQLLLVFIDNAVDHSPASGTVRLAVRPLNEGRRQLVSVAVADQGPGVPVHERERIFEPFARVPGKRRESDSTGLGLAIAQLLAARHDATLHVEDAAGGGAVFSVWLPRLPLSEAPASA